MKSDVQLHIRDGKNRSEVALGPGKVALLEAIIETGSISSAAKMLGMSYRRAWLLVDATNRCLISPAVETNTGGSRGGGTEVTAMGMELIRRYRAIERQAKAAVDKRLNSLLASVPTHPKPGH